MSDETLELARNSNRTFVTNLRRKLKRRALEVQPQHLKMFEYLADSTRINTWVEKTQLYLHMYPEKNSRTNAKILDVYMCKLRKAIAKALGVELPFSEHYLVADHRGRVGLFTTVKQVGMRGPLNGILRKLRTLSCPVNETEPEPETDAAAA